MQQLTDAWKFNANCPEQRRPARQLLEVKQTRFLRGGEAAVDPKRRFATVNFRTAKGSFDHLVGAQATLRKISRRSADPSERSPDTEPAHAGSAAVITTV